VSLNLNLPTIPALLPSPLAFAIKLSLISFLSRTPEKIMTYSVENYAPDSDAVIITVLDGNSNTIHVSISRIIGGETHISVVQNSGTTIESGILGGNFEIQNLY
jgi:hypothetical protein